MVLPQGMAARCMSSPSARGLFAWTAYHGSTAEEREQVEGELLALGEQLAQLLLTSVADLEGWCTDAEQLLESQPAAGQGKAAAKQRRAAATLRQQQLQQAAATQLLWLLFVIAANNRPGAGSDAAAAADGAAAPLQRVLLDTLVSIRGAPGSGRATALHLLPGRLRDCISTLLRSWGALQFDAVAQQLLATAAALGQPWVVLYCSHTDDEAPAWASSLPVLMVDSCSQHSKEPVASFSVDALFDGRLQQHATPGAEAATGAGAEAGGLRAAAARELQAPAAAKQQLAASAHRHARAAASISGEAAPQTDGGDASTEQGSALLDDTAAGAAVEQPAAALLTAWMIQRLQRWRARALWRLRKPLTLLERLQREARTCLAAHHRALPASAGSSAAVAAGGGVQQYVEHYVLCCCPLLVCNRRAPAQLLRAGCAWGQPWLVRHSNAHTAHRLHDAAALLPHCPARPTHRCACLSTCSCWRRLAACCVTASCWALPAARRWRTSCWMTHARDARRGRSC